MGVFDQSQNEWEKTNALNFVYLDSKLDLDQITIATQFYERIKDKPLRVLERYHGRILPKNFCDSVSYIFDKKRQARRTALFQARIEKHAEKEMRELERMKDHMFENGISESIERYSDNISF